MTSHEQSPENREASFAEKATYAALGALLAGALVGYSVFDDAGDDDDRPPIIVRNGSVEVLTSVSGGNGARGTLEDAKITGQKVWYHNHDGKKPKNLTVFVSDLDPNAAGSCSTAPDFFAQRVQRVTVTYTYSGPAERTLVFELGKNNDGDSTLMITADPNATPTPTGDYLLTFNEAEAQLKSVTIAHKDKDDVDKTPTCTFAAGSGQIAILQRK